MSENGFRTAFLWIVGILIGISVTAATWSLGKTATIDARVQVIEDTRFSEADALSMEMDLRRDLVGAVEDIKECLNKIQRGTMCE